MRIILSQKHLEHQIILTIFTFIDEFNTSIPTIRNNERINHFLVFLNQLRVFYIIRIHCCQFQLCIDINHIVTGLWFDFRCVGFLFEKLVYLFLWLCCKLLLCFLIEWVSEFFTFSNYLLSIRSKEIQFHSNRRIKLLNSITVELKLKFVSLNIILLCF